MIYLYVKIHRKTGLKYFGKTEGDPHTYCGSGKYWKRHLKVHGLDIETLIVGEFTDKNACKRAAMEFSKLHDIVKSGEWANLKPEELDGGWMHINATERKFEASSKGGKTAHKIHDHLKENLLHQTPDSRQKATATKLEKYGKDHFSDIARGPKSDEHRQKLSAAAKLSGFNQINLGRVHPKHECPHCGRHVAKSALVRFHLDKCKSFTTANGMAVCLLSGL